MSEQSYWAENIQVLEWLEPVRKRPWMYIGSTDERWDHENCPGRGFAIWSGKRGS